MRIAGGRIGSRVSRVCGVVGLVVLLTTAAHAQVPPSSPTTPAAPSAPAQPATPPEPKDHLGRSTPRGTVVGFMAAARKGDNALAAQYLDTRLTGEAAETLAHELFFVLDARLPARLQDLSEAPEGSRANPSAPDEELVATIDGADGPVEVRLVRNRAAVRVWLFSRGTLDSVPALFDEVTTSRSDSVMARWLNATRVGNTRFLQSLSVLFSVVIFYLAIGLLNRLGNAVRARLWPSREAVDRRNVLPLPARLLLTAFVGRWLLLSVPLSLRVRQIWTIVVALTAIICVVWLAILLNGELEKYIRRHVPRSNTAAGASLLRVLRRAADVIAIFIGVLATFRVFNIDPTPALAGLGVGGIAVALAAQKTLENVIAGASLVVDQAVRVGDFLKVGDIVGSVDHIGLRSTRIRTVDRTIVIIPNSQIANANLETLSARDKFKFQHFLGLRYETTSDQLRAIVGDIERLLAGNTSIDAPSVRTRFFRLGLSSLDIEIFAYAFARDWNHFMEIQEQLLFAITTIVERAGAEIAFPSQTMYVESKDAAATVAR